MKESRYELGAYGGLLLGSALLPSIRDYFPAFADASLLGTVFLMPVVGAIAFMVWLAFRRKIALLHDAFLRWMYPGATISSSVVCAVWVLALAYEEPMRRTAILSSLTAAIFCVALVPLRAILRAARCLFGGEFARAAAFAAVPVLAVALFFTGQPIADIVATSVYGPSLQARAARDDAPFAMTGTYDSVFGAVTYVVLDTTDTDVSLVERRFDTVSLSCAASVRRIGTHYYLVAGMSEPC